MAASDGASSRARQRDLVRRGYDAISLAYRDDDGRSNADTDENADRYGGWLDELATLIAAGSKCSTWAAAPGSPLCATS